MVLSISPPCVRVKPARQPRLLRGRPEQPRREQPELTDSPQRFSLRRAAGFVRHAIRVDVAILTGDQSGRFLGTVGLLQTSKAAALRLLKRLRRSGAKQVLCCEIEESLILGATSALHLTD